MFFTLNERCELLFRKGDICDWKIGTSCDGQNTFGCANHTCTCAEGYRRCEGLAWNDARCADLRFDNEHCGGCNQTCGMNTLDCTDGICSCQDGAVKCNDEELSCTDIQSSNGHCGGCNQVCGLNTENCIGGVFPCQIGFDKWYWNSLH